MQRLTPSTFLPASTNVGNLAINFIHNPAVVVIDAGATNDTAAILEAKGIPANMADKIYWTVDSDSSGSVAFVPSRGNHGATVQVTGVMAGRVTFTLQVMKDGSLTFFGGDGQGANHTISDPHHKLEVLVGNNLDIPARVQRLFFTSGSGYDTVTPNVSQIRDTVKVANVFLRQAGISLNITSEGTKTVTDNICTNITGISDFNPTLPYDPAAPTVTYPESIYSVVPTNSTTSVNYSSTQFLHSNAISDKYVTRLLVTNYVSGVLQIGWAGIRDEHQLDAGTAYSAGETTQSLDPAHKSQLAYIVSTNDKDSAHLSDLHYLYPMLVTSGDYLSSDPNEHNQAIYASAFQNAGNFSYLKFSGTGEFFALPATEKLYGLMLFARANPSLPVSDAIAWGRILAHEIGHVLNLRHRFSPKGPDGPYDGLENQPDSYGLFLGKPGSNLMSVKPPAPYPYAEDIDLHQATIMRKSPIFP